MLKIHITLSQALAKLNVMFKILITLLSLRYAGGNVQIILRCLS